MGDKVCFAVRPERLKLNSTPDTGLKISLKERTYIGSVIKTIVTLSNGREITISEPAGERFTFNDEAMKAYVTWNPENAVVMKS
jgi:spermidine/putrescine transport system ATP-binding protein